MEETCIEGVVIEPRPAEMQELNAGGYLPPTAAAAIAANSSLSHLSRVCVDHNLLQALLKGGQPFIWLQLPAGSTVGCTAVAAAVA